MKSIRSNQRFRRFLTGALVWSVAAGLYLVRAEAQESRDTIRIDTNLVSIPATVVDRDGRGVPGLPSSDFKILEDGVEQKITGFESTSSPVTVLLLVDVSGSMIEFRPQVGKALDTFIRGLRPDDMFAVAYFASESTLDMRVPLTRKRDYQYTPRRAAGPARGSGLSFTMTVDAIANALDYMRTLKGRRAIVVFGDADLSGRNASVASTLWDAEEQEALIYTVRYGEYPGACVEYAANLAQRSIAGKSFDVDEVSIVGDADLRKLGHKGCYYREKEIPKLIRDVDAYFLGLAEKTGGRGYRIKEIGDLSATFSQIIAELGQQYLLSYYSTEAAKGRERRKITVKVNKPDVAVRSRREVVLRANK